MKSRILLLCFIATGSAAQAQPILATLDSLYKFYPQEKVILSISKSSFVAGEPLYFKANVLNGYEPSSISSNLYVELCAPSGRVVKQQLIPLFSGSGDGGFLLPPATPEAVYYLRAYTRYMLNYPPAFQTIKQVPVYNPLSAQGIKPKATPWVAKAVATGGRMVVGVPAIIAVRLYSTGPLPATWQGTLTEAETETPLATVTVFNAETGQVQLTPAAGKNYVLRLTDSRGTKQIVPLPAAAAEGTTLLTTVTDSALLYTINKRGGTADGYFLLGTMHDQVVFKGLVKKLGTVASGAIPIDSLPPGVVQFTLFSPGGEALNSQLNFIHQAAVAVVHPPVLFDTFSVAAKGYNHWRAGTDTALWLSYHIQVEDAALQAQNHFLSDVYLASDFAQPIHNAGSYFESPSAEAKAALHALLATETWGRFSWTDLYNHRFPKLTYLPENYLTYTGTVLKGKNIQPGRDVNLILKAPDSSAQIVQVKTDAAGKFTLAGFIFSDTLKAFYQANKRRLLEGDISLEFAPQHAFVRYTGAWPATAMEPFVRTATDTLPAVIRQAIVQRNNEATAAGKKMQEVIISTRARNPTQELNEKLSSGMFSSINQSIIDFINDDQTSAQGYSNILEWLQGRVAGFAVQRQAGTIVPLLRGNAAAVFLDEMQVTPDMLSGLPASEIAMIKVMRDGLAVGRASGGGIAIYTRRGDMKSAYDVPSLPSNVLVGYASTPPFATPDYSEGQPTSAPDQRLVLYRNTTPKPAAATPYTHIKFYNNDSAKSYRLVISGFSSSGVPVYYSRVISKPL